MPRNKALQAELITSLENIKNKLNAETRKIYEKELDALKASIQQSLKVSSSDGSSFFEKYGIVKCIMKIINKIDHEIAEVEKEMHGMEFYPSEVGRMDAIILKQIIKEELIAIRDKVIAARHEVSNHIIF